MSLLRAFIAPIAALTLAAASGSPDTVLAQEADQIFRFAEPAGGEIEVAVWLPDGTEFAGPRPLIVISHGNGGHSQGHHDTAKALAAAGFVVAALTHPGDNWRDDSRQTQLTDRAGHISLLIDHMTKHWSGPMGVDSARIGAFGYSAGGFTVTALVGGVSDLALVRRHCEQEPEVFACQLIRRSPIDPTTWKAVGHDPRIRAAVIAAPGLGLAFTDESLARVTIPVQLWQADGDMVLPAPFNVEPIRDRLGRAAEYHRVAGAGHFDFLPPCSEALRVAIPVLCESHPSFDRTAFHLEFNQEVVRFFRDAV
ncbi:dienelactone hydrolase [Brevundimonas sp. PAMC22021]|uniref:alpha/beta hydrolase family protein n=1 Tax=Brevundimonas sp. PAMC22021 TaxID=2861285 RepID=UPI001C62E759|nr:dienelactone hydrolase [Brevundimonas sp. PAMC22021]QYF86995.1 dienelactone hydrolase [Brevundimonas sp. PAMC22021]